MTRSSTGTQSHTSVRDKSGEARTASRFRGPFGRQYDWVTVRWLALALGLGGVTVAAYLLTHTHPAYEGGLYLEMAAAVRHHHFALPATIHGYTAQGVPFAYPPLWFYVTAAIESLTGVNPVTLEFLIPAAVTLASVVPYYALARELVRNRRTAGLATALYVITPAVLQWHLSAGGLVRAPAMFLTLCGLYAGVRLFRADSLEWRWLVAATVLFALTVLSHPVYTAFYGLSYLVFFAFLDRTPGGLARGAVVALGGLALTSPWWFHVISVHGPQAFLAIDGTRSSVGGGLHRLLTLIGWEITGKNSVTVFYTIASAGALYTAWTRRYFLPVWAVVTYYGLGENRFTFVAASMLSAILVVEVVIPRCEAYARTRAAPVSAGTLVRAVLVVVLLATLIPSVAYSASAVSTSPGTRSMPQTVNGSDKRAMWWVANETPKNATFVAVGNEGEWLPYYTHRTLAVSPWGTEWTGHGAYASNMSRYRHASKCHNASCLTHALRNESTYPDYIYVPKGRYTIAGRGHAPPKALIASLRKSPAYTARYENSGVVVFETTGHHAASPPSNATAGSYHR